MSSTGPRTTGCYLPLRREGPSVRAGGGSPPYHPVSRTGCPIHRPPPHSRNIGKFRRWESLSYQRSNRNTAQRFLIPNVSVVVVVVAIRKPLSIAPCRLLVTYNVSDPQRRQLRSSTTRAAVVRRTRTEFGKRAFSVCGPDVWNSLLSQLETLTIIQHSDEHSSRICSIVFFPRNCVRSLYWLCNAQSALLLL